MEDDDQATARVLDFLSTCRQAHENMQAIEKEVGMLEEEAGMLEEAPEAAQQQAAATAAAKSSSATAQAEDFAGEEGAEECESQPVATAAVPNPSFLDSLFDGEDFARPVSRATTAGHAPTGTDPAPCGVAPALAASVSAESSERMRPQGLKTEVKAEAAAEGGRSAKSATKLVVRIKKEMAAEPAKASTSSASTSAKEEPRGELVDKKNMHQLGSEAAQQLWYQAALEEARPEKEETEEERWEEEETDSAVEHCVWLEPKGAPRPGEGPSHDENSR